MSLQSVAFSQFASTIADVLGIDPELVTPSASLSDDVAVDSLQMFELLALTDDYGMALDEEEWMEIGTFGELFALFEARATVPLSVAR